MNIVILIENTKTREQILKKRGNIWLWVECFVIEYFEKLYNTAVIPFKAPFDLTIQRILDHKPHLVFNLVDSVNDLTSKYSCVTGVLDLFKLNYTGPDSRGLELCIDKALSKLIANSHGIKIPNFWTIENLRDFKNIDEVRFPAIVKPNFSGGSVGLRYSSVVNNKMELLKELKRIYKLHLSSIICEEYIYGRDISVGIIETGKSIKALMPCEWIFPSRVKQPLITEKIKWEKKYKEKIGLIYQPASLSNKTIKEIQNTARKIFKILNLRDYAALDFRITKDNQIYFIEANANPSLTPKSLRWNSVPFDTLMNSIVRSAISRNKCSN